MAEIKNDEETIDSDESDEEDHNTLDSGETDNEDDDSVTSEEQSIQSNMKKENLMDWRKCKSIRRRTRNLIEVSNFRVPKHKELLLKILNEIKITDFV